MMTEEEKRAYKRDYYQRNRKKIISRTMKRQAENHIEYLAYQKRHREENIELSREKSRQWKAANRERHREDSRRYGREHAEEISQKRKDQRRVLKQTVINAYGDQCACCGEKTLEFLTLDHILGDGANHRKQLKSKKSHKFYNDLVTRGFPKGFSVLCFNCNSALGFYGYCPHRPEQKRIINRGIKSKAK